MGVAPEPTPGSPPGQGAASRARQNTVALIDIGAGFKIAVGGQIAQPMIRVPFALPPEMGQRMAELGYKMSVEEDALVAELLAEASREVYAEAYGRQTT